MVYTTPEGPQAGGAFFGLKRRCCCGCTASRTKDRVRPRTTRRSVRAFWREGGAPFGNPTGGGALTLRAADWVLRLLILPSLHIHAFMRMDEHGTLLEYMVFSYLWIYFLGGGRRSFYFAWYIQIGFVCARSFGVYLVLPDGASTRSGWRLLIVPSDK